MTNKTVEVVYALPEQATVITLNIDDTTTVGEAISQSGILAKHPDIDLSRQAVGIFSQIVSLDTVPRDGDRIEIYRPLIADPKEMRRRRAAQMAERKAAQKKG